MHVGMQPHANMIGTRFLAQGQNTQIKQWIIRQTSRSAAMCLNIGLSLGTLRVSLASTSCEPANTQASKQASKLLGTAMACASAGAQCQNKRTPHECSSLSHIDCAGQKGKGTSSKHKNVQARERDGTGRKGVGWCVCVFVSVSVVIHLGRVTGLIAPI